MYSPDSRHLKHVYTVQQDRTNERLVRYGEDLYVSDVTD